MIHRWQQGPLVGYAFDSPGQRFQHALLTRLGGVSERPFAALNLGSTVGDAPAAVQENLRRVRALWQLQPSQVVSPHQVHGRRVARVGLAEGGQIIPETDALMTDTPGLALLLRFADCVPVLFYDSTRHVAALAHAGWRGVAAGVAPVTVAALQATFGSRPEELWAGIGPSIGPDHYIVGADVVEAVTAVLPPGATVAERSDGAWHLDLPGAVAAQLAAVGVQRIDVAGLCTACRTDEWYSHRAEQGQTGRFGVMVMLA